MGDTNIADQRVQIMRNNRCEQCEFHSHLARTRTRIMAALTQRRRHRGNPTGSRYGGLAFRPLQECSSVVEAGESVWRVACGVWRGGQPLHFLRTILLKRSTSLAERMHSAVRWSMPVILTSSTEPPVTPSDVLPPAASKARRILAGDDLEVGLEKTPIFLVNCWHTSGTRPPVYRSVYLFSIQ